MTNQKFNAGSSDISFALRNPQMQSVNMDSLIDIEKTNLSGVFKRVKTIILETNKDALISSISSLQVYGDMIIILDASSKGIFVFNKTGKFMRRIGRVGQGPGEYVQSSDFTIDRKNKLIYVLDIPSQNILRYNIETGTFIDNIKLNEKISWTYYIQCVGDKLYSDARISTKGETSYLIQEIDVTTGDTEKKWLPTSIYNCNTQGTLKSIAGLNVFFDRTQDSPKFTQSYMDTVITFNKKGVVPFLAIKSKDFITESDLLKLDYEIAGGIHMLQNMYILSVPKIYNVSGFMTYKNLMYYYCMKSSMVYEFIYNKTTGKTIQINRIDDFVCENNKLLSSEFPRFFTSSDDGIYAVIRPNQMTKFVEIAKAGKLVKNLDKRDQLMKLSVESNPVIFVYSN
jgi:hypothetical protein